MSKIQIYDPAMCCSTGVCGPGVDSELLRVSAMINVLGSEGKKIERFGLSQDPMAFVVNKTVNDLLQSEGVEVLPLVLVDGEIKNKKGYPSNIELAKWSGLSGEAIEKILLKAQSINN